MFRLVLGHLQEEQRLDRHGNPGDPPPRPPAPSRPASGFSESDCSLWFTDCTHSGWQAELGSSHRTTQPDRQHKLLLEGRDPAIQTEARCHIKTTCQHVRQDSLLQTKSEEGSPGVRWVCLEPGGHSWGEVGRTLSRSTLEKGGETVPFIPCLLSTRSY